MQGEVGWMKTMDFVALKFSKIASNAGSPRYTPALLVLTVNPDALVSVLWT